MASWFCKQMSMRRLWDQPLRCLENGLQAHQGLPGPPYCLFCEKKIKDKRGIATLNDKDNLKILKEHYTTIFNGKVPTDLSVLDEIKPMHIVEEMGKVPTKNEIIESINNDMKK